MVGTQPRTGGTTVAERDAGAGDDDQLRVSAGDAGVPDGGEDAAIQGGTGEGLLGERAGGGAEARHEVGAARCAEAGAGRSAAHAAGDQSGAWAGEDRGAGGAELRAAGEILGLEMGERFARGWATTSDTILLLHVPSMLLRDRSGCNREPC